MLVTVPEVATAPASPKMTFWPAGEKLPLQLSSVLQLRFVPPPASQVTVWARSGDPPPRKAHDQGHGHWQA